MVREGVEPERPAASGRRLARRTMLIGVWVAATLFGLGVAATTRIGPIVLTVSTSHGVHLGDLLAFAVAYSAALAITLRLRPADAW
jgi:hypothetical protein